MSPPPGGSAQAAATALITGASSGIGLALAEHLAGQGHGLLLVARREAELTALGARLRALHGVPVSVLAVDLVDAQAVGRLQAHVLRERLDLGIIIINAGFGQLGAFAETSWEEQERMIRLNILAATAVAKAFLPGLLARGSGRILNVASTAAFLPGPYMAVYYASKAYLLSWSEGLSVELQGSGVTVTALCPGPTRTGFEQVAGLSGSGLFASRAVMSAQAVAAIGYRAMMRGRRVAVAGWLNRLMVLSTHLTPNWILMRVARRLHGR